MFKNGMAGMLQKAQKMQQKMQDAKAEIKQLTAVGAAANGDVKITLDGEYQALEVKIAANLLSDVELLEDLILSAINAATNQIKTQSEQKMSEATGGLNLPSGIL